MEAERSDWDIVCTASMWAKALFYNTIITPEKEAKTAANYDMIMIKQMTTKPGLRHEKDSGFIDLKESYTALHLQISYIYASNTKYCIITTTIKETLSTKM